jgi:hypothetical protein
MPGDDVELEIEPVAIGLRSSSLRLRAARLEPGARVAAQLLVLVVAEARQDRLALRRGDRAALGDDGGVGDRLGQVGEQLGHRRGRLEPGFGRRGGGRAFDIGRLGDAQHGVVRGVEMGSA